MTSIVIDTSYISFRAVQLQKVADLYADSLECLAFYRFPKLPMSRHYNERIDCELIHLCKSCYGLKTLIVRDLISTATLLIIVTYARHLTKLVVRRNALRKRFDCVPDPNWSKSFVQWLRRTSRSYEDTFREVSQKLGHHWSPLNDEQFKRVSPNVTF